jgi:hypothetical protein
MDHPFRAEPELAEVILQTRDDPEWIDEDAGPRFWLPFVSDASSFSLPAPHKPSCCPRPPFPFLEVVLSARQTERQFRAAEQVDNEQKSRAKNGIQQGTPGVTLRSVEKGAFLVAGRVGSGYVLLWRSAKE